MDVIAEEGVRLIQKSGGNLPNDRDLSNATGHSPATVYFHFGSIGGVIRYIIRRRISAMHQGIEGFKSVGKCQLGGKKHGTAAKLRP